MSIEHTILELLLKPKFKHKGMPVAALGLPVFRLFKKQSVANGVFRLQEKGYIERKGEILVLQEKGKKYVENKKVRFKTFPSIFQKQSPKNLLLMFDIPEDKKAEREWFRYQLREFGYEMIQRSVWVGPSPLPKEFLGYTKSIGLKNCIKTFKLAKSYTNTQN